MTQKNIINAIKNLASQNQEIEVLWLYGSRARNTAHEKSDYDLAVAYKSYIEDAVERRIRPEILALEWQNKLNSPISIIDFNQASLPMAYTIVEDNFLVYSNNNYRQMVEEQRVMSKWELDYIYQRKHYA